MLLDCVSPAKTAIVLNGTAHMVKATVTACFKIDMVILLIKRLQCGRRGAVVKVPLGEQH